MGWAALLLCALTTQPVAASPQRVTVLVERSEAVTPALLESVVTGIREAVEPNAALQWVAPPPTTLAEMMLAMNCPALDGPCISRIIKALDVDVLVWVSAQASQLEFTLLRAWYAETPPRKRLAWTPNASLQQRCAQATQQLFSAAAEAPAQAPSSTTESPAAPPAQTAQRSTSRFPWLLAGVVAGVGAAVALVLAGSVNAGLWTVHVLVWGRSQSDVNVPLEGLVSHPVFLGWQRLGPSLLLLAGVVGAGLVLAAFASALAALVLGATAMMPARE